jgi:hypothetical protein
VGAHETRTGLRAGRWERARREEGAAPAPDRMHGGGGGGSGLGRAAWGLTGQCGPEGCPSASAMPNVPDANAIHPHPRAEADAGRDRGEELSS